MIKDLWYVLKGQLSMEKLAIAEIGNSWPEENSRAWELRVNKVLDAYNTLALANARVLAKIEPLYGIPEDDPARRAASDALGEQIIRKLKAEDLARRR